MATASPTRDDATSAGHGRSFHGRPLVRMMKVTRICAAIDSNPQRAAVVCPVRARGHQRAHPRQDRRLQAQGVVGGRHGAAGLCEPGQEAPPALGPTNRRRHPLHQRPARLSPAQPVLHRRGGLQRPDLPRASIRRSSIAACSRLSSKGWQSNTTAIARPWAAVLKWWASHADFALCDGGGARSFSGARSSRYAIARLRFLRSELQASPSTPPPAY
jgi:hypothetical protein